MHFASFDASTHYPLIRGMQISYLKPGRGALSASASLDAETIERVVAEAGPDGKAAFELHAEVVDENGVVVATTVGDYQIGPTACRCAPRRYWLGSRAVSPAAR